MLRQAHAYVYKLSCIIWGIAESECKHNMCQSQHQLVIVNESCLSLFIAHTLSLAPFLMPLLTNRDCSPAHSKCAAGLWPRGSHDVRGVDDVIISIGRGRAYEHLANVLRRTGKRCQSFTLNAILSLTRIDMCFFEWLDWCDVFFKLIFHTYKYYIYPVAFFANTVTIHKNKTRFNRGAAIRTGEFLYCICLFFLFFYSFFSFFILPGDESDVVQFSRDVTNHDARADQQTSWCAARRYGITFLMSLFEFFVCAWMVLCIW